MCKGPAEGESRGVRKEGRAGRAQTGAEKDSSIVRARPVPRVSGDAGVASRSGTRGNWGFKRTMRQMCVQGAQAEGVVPRSRGEGEEERRVRVEMHWEQSWAS